jgi:hypothetical protein
MGWSTLKQEIVPRPKGKYKFTGFSVSVPPELPPGRFILRTAYSYPISSLRTITVIIDTEPFEVLPSKEKQKLDEIINEVGKIQRRNNIVDKKAGDKIRKEPTP